jgi:hypothetical protein
MDNDGDGKTDAAQDPGCLGGLDNDETDDCFPTVGPGCPACANGIDDDTDTLTDFPGDMQCLAPSFPSENLCPLDTNLAGQIVGPVTTNTLSGKANDFTSQSCQSSSAGNDISFALDLPVPVATLTLDTIGSTASDTILSLRDGTCVTEIGCDDNGDPASNRSLLTVTNVAAGLYTIIVDAFGTSSNSAITLNVHGTVAPGTACTHHMFQAGVLACPSGTTCTSGTCQ